MLVLDEASVHKIPEIKKSLELSETKVMMIPGGLTRYLQPLDVSINKPFKDGIRKKYNEYWLEKWDIKVSRKEILNWVGEVWYDDNLTSYMIEKSFKKAGITLNIDGSEDDLFIANNDEEVEEIVAEADQMVAEADQMVAEADNEEKVDIEIVNEKLEESIDDIFSVAFAESDDEEEKEGKIYRVCKNTKIDREESELIEALQEELDESIFPKRLEDGALHKFYGIKQKKRSSASEI